MLCAPPLHSLSHPPCSNPLEFFSSIVLLGLGALIIFYGHYINSYIVASVQTPFLTVGSVFIASSVVLLLSTLFAERCIISRILVAVFGLVLLGLMLSEFAIGGASIFGAVKSKDFASGNFPNHGVLFDANYAMNNTWTACCTHNYNITLEFDMPPHPKDGKMPPHPHMKPHSDWLQVDVDEANDKLIAHADVEEICSGLDRLYADRELEFNCVDYSDFRSTFVKELVLPTLIPLASVALVAAVMSLITMIFSCKLACAANTRGQADNSSYNLYSSGAAPAPVVYSGVNYA